MSIVNDFLKKNSTTASLSRARVLSQNGLIREFQYFVRAKKVSARVLGNRMYSVEIIFTGKKNFFTHCNCPYNYQGVCKHIAAVLMRFDEDYGDSFIAARRNNPVVINAKPNLTFDEIVYEQRVDPAYVGQARRFDGHVEVNAFNESNQVTFTVRTNNYFSKSKSYQVNAVLNAPELELSCKCHDENRCCAHILAVLYEVYEKKTFPDLFVLLNSSKLLDLKRVFALKYGIEDHDVISKHVKLVFREEPRLEFSGKYVGLLPVDDQFIKNEKQYAKSISKGLLDPIQFLPGPISDEPLPKYGFGVVFAINPLRDVVHNIYGFSARYNKAGTKLLSNYTKVRFEDHLDLNEQQHEILECISRLSLVDDFDKSAIEDIHAALPLLKQIIQKIDASVHTYMETLAPWSVMNERKVSKSHLEEVRFSGQCFDIEFELGENDQFISLTAYVVCGENRHLLNDDAIRENTLGGYFFKSSGALFLVRNIATFAMLQQLLPLPEKKMIVAHRQTFIDEFVLPVTENFKLRVDESSNLRIKEIMPKIKKKKLYLSGMGQFVLFKPFVSYAKDQELNVLTGGGNVSIADKTVTTLKRDEEMEEAYIALIKSLHPKFKRQFPEEFFYLDVKDMMDNHWFFDAFEKLTQTKVEVLGLKDQKNFKYHPSKPSINSSISSGVDWFDVSIEVKFGDIQVALKDIKKAVVRQDRYINLSDGSVGILPKEWHERLSKMFRHGEVRGDKLAISSRKFLIIDQLFEEIDDLEIVKELAKRKNKLKRFEQIEKVKVPKTIKAELRPYQKEGLNWLNFLNEFGWGGILADDMGLGKTLQILTFISSQKHKTPSLIVVPTTLMFNWENEINKFSPSLKVYFHYGVNRVKDTKVFKGHDLVITTYGMVANDIEWLKKFTFNYVILDESQAIKNPLSMRFKAVCVLSAKNKLTMTGTPIENNTFDLFAQMQFVNPGLLGTTKSFKEQYSQPIDKDANPERAAELRQLIRPFILRRTKEQVATELPPKMEDILYCTMEKEQRKVYDACRNKYRNLLMGKIDDEGMAKSKIYIIEGLMKLRQICDSPRLLPGEEDYGSASVKIEELLRNIEEKTGNHKIVVFSQFVSMLGLIKKELDKDQVSYEYLDGKSSKKARQQSVDHFQSDESCRVFLISLKAGGTGLNLTAADYVFIVDPWWNPAVEEQAIDRTYRIGQDKKVFAYRMICKDTIEEKIMNYQQRKKAVAADIIQAEESFMKQLTSADIKDLFS
jgi:SNF2 family DNA or RNA helicase